MAQDPNQGKKAGRMNIVVTHEGLVEADDRTLDPLAARSLGLKLMKAADQALTQQARNFSFTTKQRTTT